MYTVHKESLLLSLSDERVKGTKMDKRNWKLLAFYGAFIYIYYRPYEPNFLDENVELNIINLIYSERK